MSTKRRTSRDIRKDAKALSALDLAHLDFESLIVTFT